MEHRLMEIIAISATVWFCGCTTMTRQNEVLAKAGSMRITRLDAEAFNAIARITPMSLDSFRLVGQDQVAGMLETEAIYKKVRWKPHYFFMRYSRSWQWKMRYFISRMYSVQILQQNLGNTDTELRRYYDGHKDEFRLEDDSLSPENRVLSPFDSVKFCVARKLFFSNYKPDSGSPNLNNPGAFHYFLTDGYQEYFVKKFYKEKYGKPFPQSPAGLKAGDGRIDEKDIKSASVLLSPQERPAFEKDTVPFIRSLVRWKLFSEKAIASGYLAHLEVKKTLEWAWKIEIAQRYVNEQMLPIMKQTVRIDTVVAYLSYFDEAGSAGAMVDSPAWKKLLIRLADEQMVTKYDSLIFPLRRTLRVIFLQNEWTDEKGHDPGYLLKKADSLQNIGNDPEAYSVYSILASNYSFTPQGSNALLKLAAIQTEKPEFRTEAIKNYRRYLMRVHEIEGRCKAMFAVGFIYDRYLDRPDLAEINYKWVLKNGSGGPLAHDAEVMLQHLGEPMPGSEELQAEAKRQGRK